MRYDKSLLTFGGFVSFFAFGFLDNLKGPLLPALLNDQSLTYRQAGTLLLAAYVGFIVATIVSGLLADLYGNRRILLAAGMFLIAGIAGLNWATDYAWIFGGLMLIGVGLGAIEVGGNGLMVELHPHSAGRYLNLLATFHGIGSLVVPIYAAWLLANEFTWAQIYLTTMPFAVGLTALFLRPRSRSKESQLTSSTNATTITHPADKSTATGILKRGFSVSMWCYYTLISAYVAVELGIAAWLVEYLQTVQHVTVGRSNAFLSGFFFLIMTGRLLGSVFIKPAIYKPAIAVSLVGAMACIVGGLLGPSQTFFLLAVAGIFLSIVFPTVTACVAANQPRYVNAILGILFTWGGIGGAVGPWTIGFLSDLYGLKIGLSATLGFGVVALLALIMSTIADRQLDRSASTN